MSPGIVYATSSFSELELFFPVSYGCDTGQMTGPISAYPWLFSLYQQVFLARTWGCTMQTRCFCSFLSVSDAWTMSCSQPGFLYILYANGTYCKACMLNVIGSIQLKVFLSVENYRSFQSTHTTFFNQMPSEMLCHNWSIFISESNPLSHIACASCWAAHCGQ